MSKFNGKKTNNAKILAKSEIRADVIGLIDNPSVIEVYCGSGEMYRSVWHLADRYTGIDKLKFFDERRTVCGDAIKALTTLDMSGVNIFDIDAYGDPYTALNIIIDRLDKSLKEFIFIITDGIDMDLRMGRICAGVRAMTEISVKITKKANCMHDLIIKDIIFNVSKRLGGVTSDFKIAKGKTGAGMRYYRFKVTCNAEIVSDAA